MNGATTTENTRQNQLLFGIGALLLCYTAVRAALLGITWDEAFSYLEFARKGKIVLKEFNTMSANDHLLNTFLMMLCSKLFGQSEFVLRIPALLAHLLFLFFSARLVKDLGSTLLVICAFIIINVNPYLLDFFSLARGYGLSVGLMMASIYYFYRLHTQEKRNTSAILSLVFACLAVLANFVLLNYCIVLFGLIVALYLYNAVLSRESAGVRIAAVVKGLVVPLLLVTGLLLFVVPYTLQLKAANALFFGGENSFRADTVYTIVNRCLYELGDVRMLAVLAKALILLVILASIVFVTVQWIKKRRSARLLFLTSMLLLGALCCLSTILQHRLLQNPYLMDRTALFLVVLFSIVLVFFIAELAKEKAVAAGMAYFTAIVALLHFVFAFNLSYVLEWKGNAEVKAMMADLQRIKAVPKGKTTASIGIPLDFEPPVNFYRDKDQLTWLNAVSREASTDLRQDYFFLDSATYRKADKSRLRVIKTYPLTQDVLAKPAQQPVIRTVFAKELRFGEGRLLQPDDVYSPGFSYILTDSILPALYGVVTFEAEVQAPDLQQDNLMMVIDFEGKTLHSWQKADIKDFIKQGNKWCKATFTCLVPEDARAQDELKMYIWNPDRQQLTIRRLEMKWLVYQDH